MLLHISGSHPSWLECYFKSRLLSWQTRAKQHEDCSVENMEKKFEGGIFKTITKGSEYHDSSHVTDMMTWNVLCAIHGEQATICICSVFV